MARDKRNSEISGEIIENAPNLSLSDLCRACRLPAERIVELVEYGVIEPAGRDPRHWRFHGVSLRRVRRVQRLERDLGINVAGAALVIELLDELEELRVRLERIGDGRE
jgi:chaperone modulatory protein CbpM